MDHPLASELFAASQQYECTGPQQCYYCGAPCGFRYPHSEPPPTPFQKPVERLAKYPGNAYICGGCWLWRRQRGIVQTLGGKYLDRQECQRHSWLLTTSGCFALTPADSKALYGILLNPPLHFALGLIANGSPASGLLAVSGPYVNHLQRFYVNATAGARVDTPLTFTLNGTSQAYTVYELEESIRASGIETGAEPGVQTLLRLLGTPPVLPARNVAECGRNADKPGDGKVTIQPIRP